MENYKLFAALAISVLCLASSVLGAGPPYEYFYNETPSEPAAEDTEQEPGQDSGQEAGDFWSFLGDILQILGGPTTISGTVNYLDDNVTLEDTSYTTGIYTINGTVERPDNSTYGTMTNPDITDPVISWDWPEINTTSGDDSINVTASGDENLSSCLLEINAFNVSMQAHNDTYFYYYWGPNSGNSSLQACCNDTANNTGCTGEAWYELETSVTITLVKSANVSSALTSEEINWTITVNNTCMSILNVTVNDTNGENYNNDSLASGEVWTVSYATTAGCSSVTNIVTANASNGYESYATTASDSVTVTHCGNGACDCAETCSSCSADCGSCHHDECDSDSDCDDDNACTEDSCDGGDCEHDTIGCSDSNPCTDDSCDEDSGCEYTDNTDSCSDGDACTINDRCSGGSCSGTQINCDDSIACTVDSCSAGTCQHVSACACLADADCDDANPCTDEVCSLGSCVYSNNTASCDDGDACTSGDYCLAGACAQGVYICVCEKDSDCDDDNTCTDERCNDNTKTCEITRLSGTPCNDDDSCTSGDTCDTGKCKSGENTCRETGCTADWSCTGWSTCVNGLQTRSCRCACPANDCLGDSSESRSCEEQPLLELLNLETDAELELGQVLRISVTDEDGNPIAARIILIRPDGTEVTLEGDSYVVDQAGVWKIRVEKEGYAPAESETNVKSKPAADLGSQISQAVKDAVDFITKEPVRFALLLATVIGIAGFFFFFLKTRKKSQFDKL